MEILFEDNYIIVCVKPAGIISQGDNAGRDNMITILEEQTGSEIFPVHRLDRETGGIMVYAKTTFAAAALSRDIAEHRFKKEYLAVVCGIPQKSEDTLTDLLFRERFKNKSYVVSRERKGVKKAELDYRLLATKDNLSLLKIALKTGRTHQIRVQFSHRKMPLLGDRRYGAENSGNGLALWAYSLSFNHPKSGEELSFELPPQNIIADYFGNIL